MKNFFLLAALISIAALSSSAQNEENAFYIGLGYSVMADDDATDYSEFEDEEGYSSLSIPIALELAYYFNLNGNLGVGPIVSTRLNVNTFEYSRSLAGVEFSSTGGVLSTHTLIGASANYYVLGGMSNGLFVRGDLGLGLANYSSIDSDDVDEENPEVNAGSLTESSSGVGLGALAGIGYSLPMGASSAFDLMLTYSLFPITVEQESSITVGEQTITNTTTVTEGANYLTLIIGFKI